MATRKKKRVCVRKKRAKNGRMVCAKYAGTKKRSTRRKSSKRRTRRKAA
jgi:hypothetical protein